MKKRVLFLLLLLMALQVRSQTIYYVTTSGLAENDGLSWATAKNLAGAIAVANGANGDMIFVKKGIYTAASGSQLIALNATKSGLKLYGGFAGTEVALEDRIFGTTAADSTILEGNNNRVINNSGTEASPITSLLYDGFTITKGFAAASGVGGGMFNSYAVLTVTNCIFKGNATNNGSGGGMYNSNNFVTVTNCKFYGNTAGANGGGGIIVSGGSSAIIASCIFDSNKATHTTSGTGGGVSTYTTAAAPTNVAITNCIFSRNEAGSRGGGMFDSQYVTTAISGCTFSDNTATTGGGMYNNTLAKATVTNCTFSGNTATNGGGMYSNEANPTVVNCVFLGNETKSSGSGAGLYNYSTATTKFVNCLFSGNKSVNAGGGIYNGHAADKVCTPIFINCTIAGNNATNNGGGMWNTGPTNSSTNPVVTNCIIYGNNSGIGIWPSSGATATVTYSNVQYTGATNEEDYSNGTGNLNEDPLFVASPAHSTVPFTTGGDYTLQSTSPVINIGNNSAISGYTTDLADDPRIYNNVRVDMGAYEYQGVLPVELILFTGKLQNSQVRLSWVTASERDNSHFNILRSVDGKEFVNIGTLQGSGTLSMGNTYSFIDANPLQGVNYYKLEQVDFDGKKSDSKTIYITTEINKSTLFAYAGNGVVNVDIYSLTGNNTQIIVTDISGRKVLSQNFDLQKGYNSINIPVMLPKGIYVANVQAGGETISAKFIK